MTRTTSTAILALLTLLPAAALAVPTSAMSLRLPSVATTGTTQGEGGAISVQAIPSYADAGNTSMLTQTTSIAAIAWPQRLFIRLIDGSSNDTLTCTRVLLRGYDQWGAFLTETVQSINETGEFSLTVFERLTTVGAYGCGAADGAPTGSDYVNITAPNQHMGLRSKVRDANDVISLCLVDESDTPDGLACATRANISTALSLSASCGRLGTERCYTVDLTTSSLFPNASPPAANDVVQMQWRQR